MFAVGEEIYITRIRFKQLEQIHEQCRSLKVTRTTFKAVQVKCDGQLRWFPKSALSPARGYSNIFLLASWFKLEPRWQTAVGSNAGN